MISLSPLLLPEGSPIASEPTLLPLSGPAAEQVAKSALAKRAGQPLLPLMFSVQALLPQLPFPFPRDPDSPPSPKLRYRSHYRYQGPEALLDPTKLKVLSDLQITLHLIDFSPIRNELARIYRPSHKGQVPFDPVSMALCVYLRSEKEESWGKVATLLAGEEGAGWRRLFGFEEGNTPSASGLRYFFQKVGPEFFTDLCPRITDLLRQYRLFPENSTFPGDPEGRGVSLSQDGMLHPARGRPSCQLATDECYQPLMSGVSPHPLAQPSPSAPPTPTPEPPVPSGSKAGKRPAAGNSASARALVPGEPTSGTGLDPQPEVAADPVAPKAGGQGANSAPPGAKRPCRAREKGLEGCSCQDQECAQRCRRASRLDPEARFIHYEGRLVKAGMAEGKGEKAKGIDVFGYRSVAIRVIDDRFAIAWTIRSRLYPADTDERTIFVVELKALQSRFPDLNLRGEFLGDAGIAFAEPLDAIWELGALRMVQIRHDKADEDFETCLRRGYDGHGRPLCSQGYPMSPNGHDYDRRRTKWVCNQLCRREPLHNEGPVAPPEGCPYLDKDRPLGQVRNVGRAFPDGSVRLAREIPYGSDSWKARYGRRNLSESRNGQLQMVDLKRMHLYGLRRNEKEIQLADFLLNLRTLGRLVREATRLLNN